MTDSEFELLKFEDLSDYHGNWLISAGFKLKFDVKQYIKAWKKLYKAILTMTAEMWSTAANKQIHN